MSETHFLSYNDAEQVLTQYANDIKSRLKQYTTMPTPSATYNGKIVQYIGTSTTAYTKGMLYECKVVAGSDPAAYEWASNSDSLKYTIDGANGTYATIQNDIDNNIATGNYSHAEGQLTCAAGNNSHTEGFLTSAIGENSHAEGTNSIASGECAHAEGGGKSAGGNNPSELGLYEMVMAPPSINFVLTSDTEFLGGKMYVSITPITPSGDESPFNEGWVEKQNETTYVISYDTTVDSSKEYFTIKQISKTYVLASGDYSHAEGYGTTASGKYSHAEGRDTLASGEGSYASGVNAIASGNASRAEGTLATASGDTSRANGAQVLASGLASYASGVSTIASGAGSHAEGGQTTASGNHSHAEGAQTCASEQSSHAEGSLTTANKGSSHAEGQGTLANGFAGHAEGIRTTVSANFSHSEGYETLASGEFSHAAGYKTIAQGECQTAIGQYNIAQGTPTSSLATDYAFIIGNGNDSAKSNALAVRWDGAFVFANNVVMTPPVVLTQTLVAGATDVTFTNAAITAGKMYDIYTTVPGLNYTAIDDTTTNQLKITYEAQSSAITVKLVIKDLT